MLFVFAVAAIVFPDTCNLEVLGPGERCGTHIDLGIIQNCSSNALQLALYSDEAV